MYEDGEDSWKERCTLTEDDRDWLMLYFETQIEAWENKFLVKIGILFGVTMILFNLICHYR
jgi:hypothetical protein